MYSSSTGGSVRRVVVTGLGLVTPLGCGVEVVWKKIINGGSGIVALSDPKYSKLPCQVAGTVPLVTSQEAADNDNGHLDIKSKFTESERRSSSQATLFSLVAAEEAISNSRIDTKGLDDMAKGRVGVCVGVGLCDLQDVQDTGRTLEERGYSKVTPYFIPRILPNLAAGQISMKYGFEGPNHCASTACASGAHSIGDAFNFIRQNYADVMVCGGSEASINPLSIATFCRLRALSTKFNSDPQKASRPFDTKRDGFVMGEGSGILVLEEINHALERGATIYGEVLGYGLSGDANHITAAREDGRGALRAMTQALQIANLKPSEVSYINCHATSTPIGDKAEMKAVRQLFQSSEIEKVIISSTKGSHGHLLGAAGALESILTILACQAGTAPPSLNIENLDNEFHGLNIISSSQQLEPKGDRLVALKNSFGFGGTNASLCFSSFKL